MNTKIKELSINSYWRSTTGTWNENKNCYQDVHISPITEKVLKVVILESLRNDKSEEIIRFVGGPTGYESYYVKDLTDKPFQHKFMYICAGTINSWPSCYVKTEDLKAILNEL